MTNQLISKPAWLVVANAETATIYQYEGPKQKLHKHEEITQTLPKAVEIMSDQRGRNKNQQMPGGESYAEPTDPRTHEKDEFCRKLAEYLYTHHQQYERLVIAAAPTILGMLRDHLHGEVKGRIVAELDKNLTNYNANTLPDHLQNTLVFHQVHFGFDDPRAKKRSSG